MERNVFIRGDFDRYKVSSINEAMNDIAELYHEFGQKKISSFCFS